MLSSPSICLFPNESLVSVPVLYPHYDQVDLCERSIFHSLRLNRQLNCLANFVRDAATNLNVTVSNVTADKFFFLLSFSICFHVRTKCGLCHFQGRQVYFFKTVKY